MDAHVNGKTVTRLLTEEQLTRYRPWFDNARQLKDLIAKLEIASLAAADQAEGWTTADRPRHLPSSQPR